MHLIKHHEDTFSKQMLPSLAYYWLNRLQPFIWGQLSASADSLCWCTTTRHQMIEEQKLCRCFQNFLIYFLTVLHFQWHISFVNWTLMLNYITILLIKKTPECSNFVFCYLQPAEVMKLQKPKSHTHLLFKILFLMADRRIGKPG